MPTIIRIAGIRTGLFIVGSYGALSLLDLPADRFYTSVWIWRSSLKPLIFLKQRQTTVALPTWVSARPFLVVRCLASINRRQQRGGFAHEPREPKPKIRTMTARDRRAFVTGRRLAQGSKAVTLRSTRRLIGLTEFDYVAALVARERRRLDATSCVLKHKSVCMGLFSTLVFDCWLVE
jgi:hypothetical protein